MRFFTSQNNKKKIHHYSLILIKGRKKHFRLKQQQFEFKQCVLNNMVLKTLVRCNVI